MFKIYDGRKEFFQWDLEQKLIVSDPTVNEVHFSHQVDSESLVCEVYELDGKRVVNVPNILLQEDWKINVYAYCSNYTKVSACFKVIPKAKPADYIYTETEVKTYDKFVDKVNGLKLFDLTEDTGLQNMKAGIYTAKPASGTNVKVQLGEGLTKITLREGATFIVGGDTTIKTHSSISFQPFKKTFLAIGQQTTNMANYVKAGELTCKFVLDPEGEGGSYYEYEVKNGTLLTTEDRTMNIDSENTAISNIPSVGAVKKYVNEHGGARVLDADYDAYVGDLETGVYTINGVEADTGCCLWFDDYCEFGMLNGIAIITKDDEELYEWFFVGLDNTYNTVSKKGTTYLDTEEECWTISTQGEVETKDNQVNDLNEPNYWTYPTTQAVVDYVPEAIKNEVGYKAYYSYDTNLLKNKRDYNNQPIFSSDFTVSNSNDGIGNIYIAKGTVSLAVAGKQGADADIKYYIETPLKVEEDNNSSITITNKDSLIDFGMFNLNGEGIESLNKAMESFVDGSNIYDYKIKAIPHFYSITAANRVVIKIQINFELYSRIEAVAQATLELLQQHFEAYCAKFVMLYHHIPEIETIEAKYIGG